MTSLGMQCQVHINKKVMPEKVWEDGDITLRSSHDAARLHRQYAGVCRGFLVIRENWLPQSIGMEPFKKTA